MLEQRGLAEAGGRLEDDDAALAARPGADRGEHIELDGALDQHRLGTAGHRLLGPDDMQVARIAAVARGIDRGGGHTCTDAWEAIRFPPRGWAPPRGMRRRPWFPLLVGAEVDDRRDQVPCRPDLDLVVAAQRLDPQRVETALAAADPGLGRRWSAPASQAPDADGVDRVGAVGDDGVGCGVAAAAERVKVDVAA